MMEIHTWEWNVHGCFWHGHEECKYFVVPKTKTEWWLNKIARNKQLDTENIKKLKSDKWNVITLFEYKLKKGNIDSSCNIFPVREFILLKG